MIMGGVNMACDCSKCLAKRNHKPIGKYHEFTTEQIKEDRYKHKADILQPFRQNEFSKEYRDKYPEDARDMVKSGVITQKQYNNAKPVWKGDVEGW